MLCLFCREDADIWGKFALKVSCQSFLSEFARGLLWDNSGLHVQFDIGLFFVNLHIFVYATCTCVCTCTFTQ